MVPTPALAAVGEDVLWCLGLGLLLGAGRDALGLLLGNGRLLCFVWDVLAFGAAAFLACGFAAGVSATGTVRWYMLLSMAAGALGWGWAVANAVHGLARRCVAWLAAPFRFCSHHIVRPIQTWAINWVKSEVALHLKPRKKHEKKRKKPKKQLQKPNRILYN